MLTLDQLTVGYAGRPVLCGIDLHVTSGELVGLLGPNGCGKTTLLRAISGVMPVMKGRVRLRGIDMATMSRQSIARAMACLPQDFSPALDFTVGELVLMGRSPHRSRWARETRRDLDATERAMHLARVDGFADRLFGQLSGGERQRVLLALCLAQEPEILLLDEPTSHLDLGGQLEVMDLIVRLRRETGLTVVGVFHDLNLAAEYCQRLVVFHAGRLVADGTPQEVLTADLVRRVYGAEVLVRRNPQSQKPYVLLAGAGGESADRHGEPCHFSIPEFTGGSSGLTC
jgi:iron complex transport system ATP-binding protein